MVKIVHKWCVAMIHKFSWMILLIVSVHHHHSCCPTTRPSRAFFSWKKWSRPQKSHSGGWRSWGEQISRLLILHLLKGYLKNVLCINPSSKSNSRPFEGAGIYIYIYVQHLHIYLYLYLNIIDKHGLLSSLTFFCIEHVFEMQRAKWHHLLLMVAHH